MVDDQGEQFVAYFLPTEETLGKRKRDAEIGVEYEPEDEWVSGLKGGRLSAEYRGVNFKIYHLNVKSGSSMVY